MHRTWRMILVVANEPLASQFTLLYAHDGRCILGISRLGRGEDHAFRRTPFWLLADDALRRGADLNRDRPCPTRVETHLSRRVLVLRHRRSGDNCGGSSVLPRRLTGWRDLWVDAG